MDDTPQYFEATDKRCTSSRGELAVLAALTDAGVDLVPQVKRRAWVFDAAVQGTKILVEYDGQFWHALPHAVARDAAKERWAATHGYTIVRIAEADWEADPAATLAATLAAIQVARDAPTGVRGDTEGGTLLFDAHFDDWRDAFVASLSGDMNVRRACIAAQISRGHAYRQRLRDAEFAAAWDEAIENAADLLEGVYLQRAIEQSDRAIEFLLKAARPAKYREKAAVELTGAGGGAVVIDSRAMQDAASTLAAWRAEQRAALADLSSEPPQ